MLVPVFISFVGPILVIRESSTLENAPESKEKAADVPLWQSVKLTLKNKTFRIYMISVATFYFGLQFSWWNRFMAADMMGLSDSQLGFMNAAAFAPVPIMLLLFNWLSKKKGAKWAFRLALLVFALAMLIFPLGWTRLGLPISPIIVGSSPGLLRVSQSVSFHDSLCLPGPNCGNRCQRDRAGSRWDVFRCARCDQSIYGQSGRLCVGAAVGLAIRCGIYRPDCGPDLHHSLFPVQTLSFGTTYFEEVG